MSNSNQGRGVEGTATTTDGITYGVYVSSLSIDGRGGVGWTNASTGEAYGIYGRNSTAEGPGYTPAG